jgi:hypothetical protein
MYICTFFVRQNTNIMKIAKVYLSDGDSLCTVYPDVKGAAIDCGASVHSFKSQCRGGAFMHKGCIYLPKVDIRKSNRGGKRDNSPIGI